MILDLMRAYADHCADRAAGRYTKFAKSQDFFRVFSTPEGQRVLLELWHMANMARPVLADAEARTMAEGQRALVYDIMREVTADVDPEKLTVNYRM